MSIVIEFNEHRKTSQHLCQSLCAGLAVKVTILYQNKRIKKKKTQHTKVSLNPAWNEALSIQLVNIPATEIQIVLDVCRDRLSGTEVGCSSCLIHSQKLLTS